MAPKSATIHHRARQDLRVIVDKYPPLAGAVDEYELAPNQTKRLCCVLRCARQRLGDGQRARFRARQTCGWTRRSITRARAPRGRRWRSDGNNEACRHGTEGGEKQEERATEKAEAKQRTVPRPGTEWLDKFSIDEEREKQRLAQEKKKRVAEEKEEKKKRLVQEKKKQEAETRKAEKRAADDEKKKRAAEERRA
jgi:hypothetical protein